MDTIKNIRLIDYRPTITVFNQLQSMRLYYKFVDVDIDRYTIDGSQQQVYLSAPGTGPEQLGQQRTNLGKQIFKIHPWLWRRGNTGKSSNHTGTT